MKTKILILPLVCILGILFFTGCAGGQEKKRSGTSGGMRNFIFLNRDRERIHEKWFLNTPAIKGAQIKYTWKMLEPEKGVYTFDLIREDLAFLKAHGKELFIQLQDSSFYNDIIVVPRYIIEDPEYGNGNVRQYGDDFNPEGWVAKRWDPAVQERFHALFFQLGREFDGQIAGINLPETAIGVSKAEGVYPEGFTPERYRDATIENMSALKKAFPRSTALLYANFMPGEWRPWEDMGYMESLFNHAAKENIGMGGPDLLPFRNGQQNHLLYFIKIFTRQIPTGIAVQEGNYAEINPITGKPTTIQELADFAGQTLQLDYIFWCTEEPYFSKKVLPYLKKLKKNR